MRVELIPVAGQGPAQEPAPTPPATSPGDDSTSRSRGTPTLRAAVSVLLLALGLCAVFGVLAGLAFRDRVLPGVQALGLDLGGLHRQEAGQRLGDRVDALLGQRPVLLLDGREVDLPPHAFGERDALAGGLLERALEVGRERPLAGMTVAARAATGGRTPLTAAPVDLAPLREALTALAEDSDRPPQDAALALRREDGGPDGVSLLPGRAGRRLNVERTAA
ncbi:MAG TPA: peptidoglycan binding domain-containing protein, partial [Chloroflexota bacterium]|nr:peptidoglycan binding domain-containing protein [Chloroflexota bacterium]